MKNLSLVLDEMKRDCILENEWDQLEEYVGQQGEIVSFLFSFVSVKGIEIKFISNRFSLDEIKIKIVFFFCQDNK